MCSSTESDCSACRTAGDSTFSATLPPCPVAATSPATQRGSPRGDATRVPEWLAMLQEVRGRPTRAAAGGRILRTVASAAAEDEGSARGATATVAAVLAEVTVIVTAVEFLSAALGRRPPEARTRISGCGPPNEESPPLLHSVEALRDARGRTPGGSAVSLAAATVVWEPQTGRGPRRALLGAEHEPAATAPPPRARTSLAMRPAVRGTGGGVRWWRRRREAAARPATPPLGGCSSTSSDAPSPVGCLSPLLPTIPRDENEASTAPAAEHAVKRGIRPLQHFSCFHAAHWRTGWSGNLACALRCWKKQCHTRDPLTSFVFVKCDRISRLPDPIHRRESGIQVKCKTRTVGGSQRGDGPTDRQIS